jgi:membrane protein involved in colicin uptake
VRGSRTAAVVIACAAVLGTAGCSSSSGASDNDRSLAMEKQIQGLQERVASLESRVAWVEVVGRKVIAAAPTQYQEALQVQMDALNQEWNQAQADVAAAGDKVATEKAAAEKAVADAKAAVEAAKAAEAAEDAAQADAIAKAADAIAAARAKLAALKQAIIDAVGSPTATPTSS